MKIFQTTRCLKSARAVFLIIILTISALISVQAQGFARKYPGEDGFAFWCNLVSRTNGYTIALNDWAFGGARFRIIDTDLKGVQQADTTVDFHTDSNFKQAWLADGSFLQVEMSDSDSIGFIKIAPGGATLWSVRYDVPDYPLKAINTITQTPSGNFFISGELVLTAPNPRLFLFKIAPDGSLIWFKTWDSVSSQEYFETESFVVHPDESISLVVNRTALAQAWVVHVNADGTEAWHTAVGNGWNTIIGDIALNSAGQLGVAQFNGGNGDGHFMLLGPAGDTLAYQYLQEYFDSTVTSVNTRSIFAYPDNQGWLLTGIYQTTQQPVMSRLFMLRLEPDGALRWLRTPNPFGLDLPYLGAGILLNNGSCVLAGALSNHDQFAAENFVPILMEIDRTGRVYVHSLAGRVFYDADDDCAETAGEAPFANWIAEIGAASKPSLYASSGPDGRFLFTDIDTGQYNLIVHSPNTYWTPCDAVLPVSVSDSTSSVSTISPVQPLTNCPFMTVSLSTSQLRRCFPSTYSVQYCNNGVVADSAFVQIVLDPYLHLDSADIPYVQSGDTLWFALGTVGILQCGTFSFQVTVDCDSTEIGQVICVGAHIFPDSLCYGTANWSGAALVGTGQCDGDSVRFVIRNIGQAPNADGLDFIIVDDHVIMLEEALPLLAPGGQYQTTWPANGGIWRLIAEQEPGHPGKEWISVGVDGCNGPPAPDVFLQFLNADGNPFTALDCQEIRGSFDPNEKVVWPRGVGPEHFITPATPLTYQLNFQNTGSDTAYTVVLRDTLPVWLDPGSIRPGAASHPYAFDLSGTGILTFMFGQIALPDSNVNEPASHGFVQFSVLPRAGIPLGTVLQNRAGIYFDLNDVVLTNTVWNTVDSGFLEPYVSTGEPAFSNAALRVYPNPAAQSVRLEWPGAPADREGRLRLFNALGQLVLEKNINGPVVEIRRGQLPGGVFWAEWWSTGKLQAGGRVVFR